MFSYVSCVYLQLRPRDIPGPRNGTTHCPRRALSPDPKSPCHRRKMEHMELSPSDLMDETWLVFGHSGTESHCNFASEVSLERSVQSCLGLSVKSGSHVMLRRIFHWRHGTWQVSEPQNRSKWLLVTRGIQISQEHTSLGPLLYLLS